MKRPEKITLAEMRCTGVRGLLIFIARIIDAVTGLRPAATDGRMTFGYPIWSLGLPARLAAGAARMCGRTSAGQCSNCQPSRAVAS
jgi:hypothetical protein